MKFNFLHLVFCLFEMPLITNYSRPMLLSFLDGHYDIDAWWFSL